MSVPFPPMKRLLVAILRGVKPEETEAIVGVLIEAGMTAIEIPLNSPDPFRSIAMAVKQAPSGVLIGAGTVLTTADVDRLNDVGGKLMVSPNVDTEVLARAHQHGMVTMPGVFSPTEALLAARSGASSLKFFPASVLGASGIAAIRAVLPSGGDDRGRRRRLRPELCGVHQGRRDGVRPRLQPLQARHDGGGCRSSREGHSRGLRSGNCEKLSRNRQAMIVS
ncbi:Entner-Doudoroff aldolase [Bradyrhizobium sp. USDA 327]